MTITDGPVTANGLLWWKVQAELARLTGWTPEHDGTSFFLGQLKNAPFAPMPCAPGYNQGIAP